MTNAEELALLEATYEEWITAGAPQSYTTHTGRSVTREGMATITARIDELRLRVSRGTNGMYSVHRLREKE